MKTAKTARISLVLAVLLGCSWNGADACGDKHVLTSGNAEILLGDPSTQGRLLVYRTPEAEELLDSRLVEVLERAGHRVCVERNERDLENRLRSEAVDLILTASWDADSVQQTVARLDTSSKIVPFIREGTPFEVSKLEASFPSVVSTPVPPTKLQTAIGQALSSR